MANYHLMEISAKGDEARVAFHFVTPVETNVAGVALKDAYKEWQERDGGALGTVLPWLAATNPTEDGQITNGEVVEHVESVQFDANATNAQKQAVLDSRWTALSTIIPDRIRRQLKFWRMNRNVP